MNKRTKKKYDKYFNIESKRWHVYPEQESFVMGDHSYHQLTKIIKVNRKANKLIYRYFRNQRGIDKRRHELITRVKNKMLTSYCKRIKSMF